MDQLNIDTLFKKRGKRIIQCKNSYERRLVYKFAQENMLNAEKIEMKDSSRNVLRCRDDCGGCLSQDQSVTVMKDIVMSHGVNVHAAVIPI